MSAPLDVVAWADPAGKRFSRLHALHHGVDLTLCGRACGHQLAAWGHSYNGICGSCVRVAAASGFNVVWPEAAA